MKKEKIRTYLQYPWKISDSQYYKSLINLPPKEVEYICKNKEAGMISGKRKFFLFNFLKSQIRSWANKFGLVIPNAHLSPRGNYDLIHCAHCLSKNTDSPWVADFESWWQMWISGKDRKNGKKSVLRYLQRDNCKKIIAWTEAGRDVIVKNLPGIRDKVEVVYYAMEAPKLKKKKGKDITLFFSGRHFYGKGGLDAVEAIDRLTKKYSNVRGIVNGVIPDEVVRKYKDNEKIEFFGLMPHEEVLELYKRSDIFVYPGYSDTFGFVFIEAMAYGLPVVTVDGFARREIIENKETGFVIERGDNVLIKDINSDVVDKIIKKVSVLLDDEELLVSMRRNCLKEIVSGKFSVRKRNIELGRIYEESIE